MPSDQRATCWSLTINNPTQSDEDWIAQARQRGWKVEGQKEVGKEGTPHYQLMVKTPQVRFSAVKKAFPRAHIEVARNVKALEVYVHKEDTKVGEMAVSSEKYPSQARVFAMFAEWIDDDDRGKEPGRKGGYLTWAPETWLKKFEAFTDDTIQKGFYIEGIAVNPQTLAIVKRFGCSIKIRADNERCAATPQTDRQTDSQDSRLDGEYNNADEEEVRIQAPSPVRSRSSSSTSHSSSDDLSGI